MMDNLSGMLQYIFRLLLCIRGLARKKIQLDSFLCLALLLEL